MLDLRKLHLCSKEGLNFVPAGVVAELPWQAIMVVRIHNLECAESLAVDQKVCERHKYACHGRGNFAKGAGEPVEKVFLLLRLGVSVAEQDVLC